jgi:trk system potassium uptake protein TrkA
MKMVVVGAGEVGTYLCSVLSARGNDVTVIDTSEERTRKIDEQFNVKVLHGNGASASVLVEAGVDKADHFLAMTSDDKVNILSCSLAKALGARRTISRIHDQTYIDNAILNYQVQFGIDHMLNPERLCAVELAKRIRNPGRVAVENFARGQVEVQQVRLRRGSRMIGKTVADTNIAPKARIGYIQREGLNEVPTAQTVLQENDLVTLFGAPENLFEVRSKFEPGHGDGDVKVVLSGGGETAISLIRLLAHPRFRIRVLEKDVSICKSLSESFEQITVINGDATSVRVLEEEQISGTHYFVACTKDDENNIVTCLQASKMGAQHVQAVINKGDYEDVIETLRSSVGIEQIVSPRIATANEVLRYISPTPCIELGQLQEGGGTIVEIHVSEGSPAAGMTLRQIAWPAHCVVTAIQHRYEARLATADEMIQPGDRVLLITRQENIPVLRDLLHKN